MAGKAYQCMYMYCLQVGTLAAWVVPWGLPPCRFGSLAGPVTYS
jgi:hypothetical protein